MPHEIGDGSSEEISQRALNSMLKFDEQAWNDHQGRFPFVARKTQEFLETMNQMASLDHNTRASDRPQKVENRLDMMMKDIAIQARTQYVSKTLSANNTSMFDKNQRKMLRF